MSVYTTERARVTGVWKQMHRRCERPDHKQYAMYGGRGITVCERWKKVRAFIDDMGPRPPGFCIDRIDNDKGYSPDNCRWVSRKTSTENRRCSIMVEENGQREVLSAYCRRRGLNYRTVLSRLRVGVPLDRAIDPTPMERGRTRETRATAKRLDSFGERHG